MDECCPRRLFVSWCFACKCLCGREPFFCGHEIWHRGSTGWEVQFLTLSSKRDGKQRSFNWKCFSSKWKETKMKLLTKTNRDNSDYNKNKQCFWSGRENSFKSEHAPPPLRSPPHSKASVPSYAVRPLGVCRKPAKRDCWVWMQCGCLMFSHWPCLVWFWLKVTQCGSHLSMNLNLDLSGSVLTLQLVYHTSSHPSLVLCSWGQNVPMSNAAVSSLSMSLVGRVNSFDGTEEMCNVTEMG